MSTDQCNSRATSDDLGGAGDSGNTGDTVMRTASVTRIHDWFRLLRALLAAMLPTALAGMLVTTATAAQRLPVSDIVSMMVNLMVHTCFWVSLVYAYVDWRERTGEIGVAARPTLSVVLPDTHVQLVRTATRRVSLGEVIAPLILWASFVSFSFGQRRIAPLDDGVPIPVINPDAWPRWLPIVAWMAANTCAALIATFRMGRWTPATAFTAVATSVIVCVEVVRMVVVGSWIDPAFLAALRLDEAERDRLADLTAFGSVALVVSLTLWTVTIALRGWRRDRSAPPLTYD